MEALDHSKNGLITEKEFKEAVKKVSQDNDLHVDEETVADMIEELYVDDKGNKASSISR